jgi:hypothetical protein
MEEGPKFRVGDAFPADDERRVAAVRLLLASRHLSMAILALGQVKAIPAQQEIDYRTHLILMIISATEEATRAFLDADACGCFEPLEGEPGLVDSLSLLRHESDPSRADSLWNRLIVRIRNNAGAHWNGKLIARALRALENEELPAFLRGESARDIDLGIPLGSEVAHGIVYMATGILLADEENEERMARYSLAAFNAAMALSGWMTAHPLDSDR